MPSITAMLLLFHILFAPKPPIIDLSLSPLVGESRREGDTRQNSLAHYLLHPLSYPYNVAVSGNKDAVDSGCVIHSGLWGVRSMKEQ
jgi:hypothetical protein